MASSFKSHDTNISEIMKDIDSGINQLPDFQRGWVWDDERIRSLIASITNSHPVGALMFLEYGSENVRFKCRTFIGNKVKTNPEILVLDGQQRLTSIYNAMFCQTPVPTQTVKKDKIERYYYLDIYKCLSSSTDREEAIVSMPKDKIIRANFARDIELDLSTKENEYEKHHFPLNIVFDPIAPNTWMIEYLKHHNFDAEISQQYTLFVANILVPIQSYKIPVITLNKDTPKDAVCQVFENVNTGGVSLTVFELVTATFAADNFALRDDWFGAEDDQGNRKQGRHEYMTEKHSLLSVISDVDFLVAITLLSRYYLKKRDGDSAPAVTCKRQDILNLTIEDYLKYADNLMDGFIETAKFLGEQRIFSERDLPYTTQFIPFSVLFTLLGKRAHDATIRNKLSRWYWCGVLGEMYGGANETRYANDVTGVMSWLDGGDEPDTRNRANFHPTRLLSLQTRLSAAYKGIMALILKAKAQDFISGKEMDFTAFLNESIDIHHIFPRRYCEEHNIERRKWNSIINKTPLSFRTNRIIGGNAPSIYLKKIEQSGHVNNADIDKYVESHLIKSIYLRNDNFHSFFNERAKALLTLINMEMGKSTSGLTGDDIINEFGGNLT